MDDAGRKKRKLVRYLSDIVEYGEAARQPLVTLPLDRFITDRDVRHIVYYRVQCVSEAVKNVLAIDPEVASRAPEIPWARVKTIGNIFRHEYGDVEAAVIWRTVTGKDLPALIAVARRELERIDV